MIDSAPFYKIVPILIVALISPGPDFFAISSIALSRGRLAGVQAACGISLGCLVYISLSICGLSLLLTQVHEFMLFLRVAGGLYLLYLGVQLWRASLRHKPINAEDTVTSTALIRKQRHPVIFGLLTNLTNPKAIIFFSSIFALALPVDATVATKTSIILVTSLLPGLWFSFISFCLSTPASRSFYLRWTRWIDRACGTFLTLFGARLIFSSRN